MTLGYMVALRTQFAACLRPFKGGTAGEVEIRRYTRVGGVAASVPAEVVSAHWQELSTEALAALDMDLGGRPGFQVFFDGVLDTAVAKDDVLILPDDREIQVQRTELRGNNSPIDSAICALRVR